MLTGKYQLLCTKHFMRKFGLFKRYVIQFVPDLYTITT